jgi:ATP-dependent protease ClpP protease subunit
MAKKIRVSGDIGWETTIYDIRAELSRAGGEDLEIEIASPGGSVFDGIEIYNAIRDYKREHPGVQVMIALKGLAASMASYIAAVEAADLVVAEDNAVGMYHNPWNFAAGDYREMEQNAAFLKGLANLLAKAYMRRSGKSAAEIIALMDGETWLFGEELKTYGFVDEILPVANPRPEDKAAAVSAAKMQFGQLRVRAKSRQEAPERVAAIMRAVAGIRPESASGNSPALGGNNATPEGAHRRGSMDPEQIRKDHPETYAKIMAAGAKQEQDRVAALSAMKKDKRYEKIGPVQDCLDECIATGKSKEEAIALVMAVLSTNSVQAAIESPGDISTGAVDSATGEKPAAGKKTGFVED